MIDNMTIRAKMDEAEFMKMTGLLVVNAPIDSDKVKFDWQNLRFCYYPNDSTLTISNSLHKFYNLFVNANVRAAINHNDFRHVDFCCVADFLSEVMGKSLDALKVSSRFEFGLNVDTGDQKPFDVISRYMAAGTTHIHEFYTVAPQKGRPIQRNCNFSDWYIKGYDKSKQAQVVRANILRFEVVVTELRKLRAILQKEDVSMETLTEVSSWNQLFDFLISTYRNIRKSPLINNSPISPEDIDALYRYICSPKRKDLQRAMSPNEFRVVNEQSKLVYLKYDWIRRIN